MLEWEKPNGIRRRRGKKLKSHFDAMLLGTGSPEVHTTKAGANFFLHNIPVVFLGGRVCSKPFL